MSASGKTPRIPFAAPAADEAGRAVEANLMAARGQVSLLYRVLLNSPVMADGWERLMTAVRLKNSLSPRVREMIILRVAVLNRAPYEFEAHQPIALAEGVSVIEIDALKSSDFEGLSPIERLVMAATDTMTRDVDLPDSLFAQLAEHFDQRGLVDLLVTIAAYNMVSRFLAGAGLG